MGLKPSFLYDQHGAVLVIVVGDAQFFGDIHVCNRESLQVYPKSAGAKQASGKTPWNERMFGLFPFVDFPPLAMPCLKECMIDSLGLLIRAADHQVRELTRMKAYPTIIGSQGRFYILLPILPHLDSYTGSDN